MMGDENIRTFVKKTLRCTCPDEVFQHIERKDEVSIDHGIVLGHEINVGNRLLIYVVGLDGQHYTLKNLVSHLIRMGIRRRDEDGFNRFRLVLLAADPQAVEEQVSEIFSSLSPDDRVHLHVIGQDELDEIK